MTSLLALFGCERGLVKPIECTVSLAEENTFRAGEPVTFNIDGNADNIIFYSGETGHQYVYKDRFIVPVEEVNSAVLNLQMWSQYGNAGAMSIYISNSFEGLNGEDGEADRATIRSMIEGGMSGWTQIPYTDDKGAAEYVAQDPVDLASFMDNFSLAFHWNPAAYTATQRTYRAKGDIAIDITGSVPSSIDLSTLDWTVVMMNEQLDPYHMNAGNGSVRLDQLSSNGIVFQGIGANQLDYSLDAWVISTPRALNRVANDQPVVVKNMQNYLGSYTYTYNEPGTYTATFVSVNSNVDGESEITQQIEITILPNE